MSTKIISQLKNRLTGIVNPISTPQKPDKNLEHFDVIIIGANIIGAGIAREASLRGMKTLIINMEDFASGCNANPGELVFGVERYLENHNLSLTWDTSQERKNLKNIAPQLIKNIPFILPETPTQKKLQVGKKLGLALYDYFAGFDKTEKPIHLNKVELENKLPGINTRLYPEGEVFYDTHVNDYRLTITNVLDSVDNHAKQLNYWYVDRIESFIGYIKVFAKDMLSDQQKELVGSILINTTGPYVNANLKKWGLPTYDEQKIMKSFHFFLPTINEQYGVVIPDPKSERVIYAVPWENSTLVGVSDHELTPALVCPSVTKKDVQYVLNQLNQLYPDKGLDLKHVIGGTAGIKAYIPGNKHKIVANKFGQSNVITVFGGKLTLYRKIAVETVDLAVKLLGHKFGPSLSASSRMRGSQFNEETFKSFMEHRLISNFGLHQLPIDVAMNILRTYGTEVNQFEFIPFLDKPFAKERIFPGTNNVWAQFYYSIVNEFIRKPSDFAARRTNLFLDLLKNPDQITPYFQKAGEILKLTPKQIEEDRQQFLDSFKIID